MKKFIPLVLLLSAITTLSFAQSSEDPVGDPALADTDMSALQSSFDTMTSMMSMQAALKSAEANYYNSAASAISAQQARDKAAIGSVTAQSAYSNEVSATSISAVPEAKLVIAHEMQVAAGIAAKEIKTQIGSESGKSIIIVNSIDELTATEALSYDRSVHAITLQFSRASQDYDIATAMDCGKKCGEVDPDKNIPAFNSGVNFTTAGAVLQGLQGLLSYGYASYGYASLDVGQDIKPAPAFYLAQALRNKSVPNPLVLGGNLTARDIALVGADIERLETSYLTVVGRQATAKARSVELKKSQSPKAIKAAEMYDRADAEFTKAIQKFETFSSWLEAVPAGKSTPNLVSVIRQKRLKNASDGAYILVTSATPVASNYTRRTLWDVFLSGPPVFVMGGVTLHYSLFDPATGKSLAEGVVNGHSGYNRLHRVARNINTPVSE